MNGSHGKRMVREDWIKKPRHCHYVTFFVETNIMVGMYLFNDSKANVTPTEIVRFIMNEIGGTFYPVFQLQNLNTEGNYRLYQQIKSTGGFPKLIYTEFDLGTGTWSNNEVTLPTIAFIPFQNLLF